MSSMMIFLMLMVHDLRVVKLRGGLRLGFVVVLQNVEGLHEDLVEVVLGVVFAFVFGFGAASALGLGVDLGLLTGRWSFLLFVVVLRREVFFDGLSGLPLASGGHGNACSLELLFVLCGFLL